jgi:hypothetical protein
MREVWLAVGLAACADIPDEPFDDGAVTTRPDDTTGARIVSGPNYELQFGLAGADFFPMPDRLVINNRDILEDATADCAFENKIGVALFPGLVITSDPGHLGPNGTAQMASIQLVEGMEGPGAIQYEVGYAASIRAGGGTQTLMGHSTFTFFASGRIVRHDSFSPFTGATPLAPLDPFGCSDGAFAGFFLTSYWAFERTGSPTLVDVDGNSPQDNLTTQACTSYGGLESLIAVSWQTPGSGEGTRFDPNSQTTAQVFDFIPGESAPIMPGQRNVTSAIKVITGGDVTPDRCGELMGELDDPPLMVDERMISSSDENGIYQDSGVHESTTTLRPAAGRLPLGAAIALDLGGATHAEVTKDPADGASDPVAYVQRLADGRTLFVLRDALSAGETITIEPF